MELVGSYAIAVSRRTRLAELMESIKILLTYKFLRRRISLLTLMPGQTRAQSTRIETRTVHQRNQKGPTYKTECFKEVPWKLYASVEGSARGL